MNGLPPVVVLPPSQDGGRQVTVGGEAVGVAYSLFEVLDLLHSVGLPATDTAIDDPQLIDWRGGGPYDWNDAV
ncbi:MULTISPECIES: hypothetical protein [unclassified Streptomyces]|uniref:hypothetical protein n=1 Tax=unclassified Streptomyces TaxID=2593676 RepID=UPI003D740ED6